MCISYPDKSRYKRSFSKIENLVNIDIVTYISTPIFFSPTAFVLKRFGCESFLDWNFIYMSNHLMQ